MQEETTKDRPQNLCLVPFSSLHIAPNGSLRLCPTSLQELNFVSDQTNLNDLWNCDAYQTIRTQMQAGQRPKTCENGCYKLEDRGLESRRQSYNEKYQKMAEASLQLGQSIQQTSRLKHLDLSFSNTCNLSCAMCSSLYSNSWYKLEQQALEEGIDFRSAPTAPFRISTAIIHQILDGISSVEQIMIKGGEPFADPNCLMFLKKLAEKKSSLHPNLKVYIQTNGTILNQSLLEIFQSLPIELGISIDGVGKTYEWIRGFPFEKISSNIETLCQESGLQNIHLNFTLSAFNLFNMTEMLEFYRTKSESLLALGNFYFSSIAKQHWSNPLGIPKELRDQALGQLEAKLSEVKEGVRGQQRVLQYLNLPDDATSRTQVARWVAFMNKTRGFSL